MEKNASKSLIAGRFETKNGNNRVEVASVYLHITFVNKLLFFCRVLVFGSFWMLPALNSIN